MKKTILLADDSVTIRKVVELTFMGESFDLVSVGSGTEAIERLEQGDDLDLVIADVHMPGADGYEVCRAVKQRSSSIPVLLLVGTFENFVEEEAEKAGADDHLKKPFDSQDLLSRVRSLLAEAPVGEESAGEDAVSGDSAGAGSEAASGPTTKVASDETAGAVRAPDTGEVVPEAVAAEASAQAQSNSASEAHLSEESVDRIARRVVELLSEEAIRNVAWEVIPDLAEVVIKERLNELESQVE